MDIVKATERIDMEKKRGYARKGPGFRASVLPKSGHGCEREQIQ